MRLYFTLKISHTPHVPPGRVRVSEQMQAVFSHYIHLQDGLVVGGKANVLAQLAVLYVEMSMLLREYYHDHDHYYATSPKPLFCLKQIAKILL